MKNVLLGSAAAALMIAPAVAGPVAITVGGYHNTLFYGSQDFDSNNDASSMNIDQDAEIIFKGKAKLDSGIEVGLQVQFEAASQNTSENDDGVITKDDDQVDEHYIYVKGDFGKFVIGSENSAARMLEAGHDKYLGYSQIGDSFLAGLKVGYTKAEHSKLTGDSPKMTYVSPKFGGLQVGYSMTPSTSNSGGDDFGIENDLPGTSYGVRYKGKVGPVKIAVSVGSESVDNAAGKSREDSSTRLQVTMNRVKFSYNDLERDTGYGVSTSDTFNNMALSYKLSKKLVLGVDVQTDEDNAGDTIYEHSRIGGTYKLGSGVKLTFSTNTAEETEGATTEESSYTAIGLLMKF